MEKNKILIVDDEPINRFILNKFLSRLNYEPVEAGDGIEAIAMLEKHGDIETVLLDLNMPKMDGYGFLNHIHTQAQYSNRPLQVIIVSASHKSVFNTETTERKISTQKVCGYVNKPVELDKLVELISKRTVSLG